MSSDPFLEKFLSETDKLILDNVKKFCERYLTDDVIKKIEETDAIPNSIVEEAKNFGLFGIRIPAEYGGVGLDLLPSLIVQEIISSFSLSVGIYLDQTLFVEPLKKYGTEEQKIKYLRKIVERGVTTTSAMTEPEAGSDVLSITTQALREGDGWRLNGRKTFITMGDQANLFIIFAKTSQRKDKNSLSAFLIEKGKKGLEIGQPIKKSGQLGTHINEIFLNDVFVDSNDVLGSIGQGYEIAMYSYYYGRLVVAAQALGLAEGLMRKSVNYSLIRNAFGQPINKFQLIKDYLAKMDVMIETAKSMIYRTALFENTPLFPEYSSISKLYATEVSTDVARMAIKIHGGLGITYDAGIERALRDSVIQEIYEGTNEIQKLIISKSATERYKG
jgi:alkylation response protein AidB-like acyl-CoA dehydrogenase